MEIQKGSIVNSYITNGLLIYGYIFAHFLVYSTRKPFLINEFGPDPL
jgi:hypothetical protein